MYIEEDSMSATTTRCHACADAGVSVEVIVANGGNST